MIIRIGILLLGVLGFSITTAMATPVNATSALLLSQYIKQNKLQEARNASLVNSTLFLNVTSHAGFLTVDEKYNSNMYFWYFPVADKPVNKTPWIIWLQGGPGASSLAGLFDEIGPFEYRDGQLNRRKWSWGDNYSLLFVDNPVGAGYSFTDSYDGFVQNMEMCSKHLYSALQQFLTIFPELRSAPLYIAGESYAGRYVPSFGYKILEEHPTGNASVNLTGIMMGNPVIDRIDVTNLSSVYYHWGLIDSQGLLAAKPLQDKYSKAVVENNLNDAWNLRDKLLDLLLEISQQQNHFNLVKEPYSLHDFEEFIAQPNITEAMHVGSIKFTFNNGSVDAALMKDFLGPIRPKIEKLLEHYKIMIYCGQLDLTAPCELGADSRRRRWHWSHRDEFLKGPRRPWVYNGTIAGYIKQGGGLTEVLVRASGHLVPRDTPAHANLLISSFINQQFTSSDFAQKPEYTQMITFPYDDTPHYDNKPLKPGLIIDGKLATSIVFNVILAFSLLVGLVYFLKMRQKKNCADRVYYSPLLTSD